MIWIIVTLIIFGTLGVLIWRGTKGRAYEVEELAKPISELLERGFDGGTLVIEELVGRRFLQLRKYVNGKNDEGLELAFPKVKWAKKYFLDLVEFCESEKLNYTIEREDPERETEFLYLNFGDNALGAAECVGAIYRNVFRISDTQKLFVCLRGAEVAAVNMPDEQTEVDTRPRPLGM